MKQCCREITETYNLFLHKNNAKCYCVCFFKSNNHMQIPHVLHFLRLYFIGSFYFESDRVFLDNKWVCILHHRHTNKTNPFNMQNQQILTFYYWMQLAEQQFPCIEKITLLYKRNYCENLKILYEFHRDQIFLLKKWTFWSNRSTSCVFGQSQYKNKGMSFQAARNLLNKIILGVVNIRSSFL